MSLSSKEAEKEGDYVGIGEQSMPGKSKLEWWTGSGDKVARILDPR